MIRNTEYERQWQQIDLTTNMNPQWQQIQIGKMTKAGITDKFKSNDRFWHSIWTFFLKILKLELEVCLFPLPWSER